MKTTTGNIKTDYLEGAEPLKPFYQYPLKNPDFGDIVRRKGHETIDRKLLREVIEEQYEGLPEIPKVRKNIALLSEENTFTVTTGHQLVLMGGPLFTTYKVLSTIKLAQEISESVKGVHVVPIFWIHTEDHDFEEINHFFTGFASKKTYQGQFSSAVGNHILESSIERLLPDSLDEKLKAAFSAGKSLTDAYRAYMHELFGPYGVVMLDASDHRLKASFREVMNAEVFESVAMDQVNACSEKLSEAGYPLQISPREINLFYVDQEGRNRIIASNGGFEILDRGLHFTAAEFRALIQEQPEKISPNVSLRPLYQETILPNLAYFGGWGELAYWLQLKGVFDHFGVAFPLVLPRMSATIFTRQQLDEWTELGFEIQDIKKGLYDLYRQYMPKLWDDADFNELAAGITDQILLLRDHVRENISATLSRSVEAEKVKMNRFIQNLIKKVHRVKRSDNRKLFEQIEGLKNSIEPDRLVQERVLSLLAFPEYSPEQIISVAWDACSPLDFTHKYLILD